MKTNAIWFEAVRYVFQMPKHRREWHYWFQIKKKDIILQLILKGAVCAWSTSRLDQVPYPPHIDLKISSKLHMLHADDNLSSI
jgi:hypothetical protein